MSTSKAPEAPAGMVTAVDAAGLQSALASQKGKVVVLNFWATWCEPCREEFPDLVRFAGERPGSVALVTVSLDDPGMADGAVRRFLDEMRAPAPRLIKGPGDPDAFINSVDPSWSGALPATFIHRPDGSRAHAVHGSITYAKLAELSKPLLGAN